MAGKGPSPIAMPRRNETKVVFYRVSSSMPRLKRQLWRKHLPKFDLMKRCDLLLLVLEHFLQVQRDEGPAAKIQIQTVARLFEFHIKAAGRSTTIGKTHQRLLFSTIISMYTMDQKDSSFPLVKLTFQMKLPHCSSLSFSTN